MLTEKEVRRLINFPCKVRGEQILFLKKEVVRLGGKKSIKQFEKKVSEAINQSFEFKKIKDLDWHPVGVRTVCLLTLRDLFKLKDSNFIEMGARAIGDSIIVKLFFKYFFSREAAFKYIPEYWKKICTCGRIEPVELIQTKNGKKGHFIVRLYDFKFHPLHCKFLLGSILQLAKLLGGKNARIEETKCIFNKDSYHEFKIDWS